MAHLQRWRRNIVATPGFYTAVTLNCTMSPSTLKTALTSRVTFLPGIRCWFNTFSQQLQPRTQIYRSHFWGHGYGRMLYNSEAAWNLYMVCSIWCRCLFHWIYVSHSQNICFEYASVQCIFITNQASQF